MLGGIGSIGNAALLVWLIIVTIRYVKINAHILRTNQVTLEKLEQQIRDAQYERAGPVMAFVNDHLRFVRRWEAWSSDPASLNVILKSPELFVPAGFNVQMEQASRISIPVYESLAFARQELKIFGDFVNEIQLEHRADPTWRPDRDEYYIRRIGNKREFLVKGGEYLEAARSRLAELLGADAIVPKVAREAAAQAPPT